MYTIQDLSIKNSNNQNIVGKIFIPGDSDPKNNTEKQNNTGISGNTTGKNYPVVICSHGFNSCFNDLIHHGPGYAEAGIVCVFFDFCGGGERTLSEGTLEDMTVLTETEDLLAVINYIATQDFIDEKNIFLLGESMGGFVTAYLATQVRDIAGLILWYPAFVIPEDSKRRYDNNDNTCFGLRLSPDYNSTSKDIDIEEMIKSYTGPVQLIHGDQDPLVPIEYSKKAVATYNDAHLELIAGAGHGFDGEDSKHAREVSIDFICKHIR